MSTAGTGNDPSNGQEPKVMDDPSKGNPDDKNISGDEWRERYYSEVENAKKLRARAQGAESKVESFEKEAEKARRKKMEDDGELKELVATLNAELEDTKAKAEKWDSHVTSTRSSLIEQLPEDEREEASKLPLDSLRYLVSKVTAPPSDGDDDFPPRPPVATPSSNLRDPAARKFHEMDENEKRENWNKHLQSFTKKQ